MRLPLFIICMCVLPAGMAWGKGKKKSENPTGYMSYSWGVGYSNYSMKRYDPNFYRDYAKTRTQGAFTGFAADVAFPVYGSYVINKDADGLLVNVYLPFGFAFGKARGTDIDPFLLGYRVGAGASAIYRLNKQMSFSVKEYWATLYENPRRDGIDAPDAGLYTAFGINYNKLYVGYARNFIPGGRNRETKPLSVVNIKYNLNKGNCIELNTEYSRGKVDYKLFPGDVSHVYPYGGYTILVGYAKVF